MLQQLQLYAGGPRANNENIVHMNKECNMHIYGILD